jgi:excisionase family DNA binding protein
LDERLISLKDAAAQSGLSTSFLRRLCRQGTIDAVKVGRDWIITWSAVAAYLEDPIKRSHDPRKNRPD